jgi:hypothetical protein
MRIPKLLAANTLLLSDHQQFSRKIGLDVLMYVSRVFQFGFTDPMLPGIDYGRRA